MNSSLASECSQDKTIQTCKKLVAGLAKNTSDDFSKALSLKNRDLYDLARNGIGSCFIMKSNEEIHIRNPSGSISGRTGNINVGMMAKELRKLIKDGKCNSDQLTDSFVAHRDLVKLTDSKLSALLSKGVGKCSLATKRIEVQDHFDDVTYYFEVNQKDSKPYATDDEANVLDHARYAILRGECD